MRPPNIQRQLQPAWPGLILVLLWALCRAGSVDAGDARTNLADNFSAVTKRVQGWVDRGYYPGAAMLVAKDNKIIYEKCFGNYTPDTEVLIASAGKWLAAATIMTLVDEGKLSLDDHPSKWLPEFKDDPKDQATLRQMLSHTSGYRPYQPDDQPVDKYQTPSGA
jgi:CubicO group peptidase (beta-lactamase class C family)